MQFVLHDVQTDLQLSTT